MAEAENEAVGAEEPRPEEERAFLAGPERGKLIGRGQRAIGVVEDVVDGVVVGEGGVNEGEGRAAHADEAGEAGAARGFAEVLGGDGQLATVCDGPECEGSGEERVGAEDQCQK